MLEIAGELSVLESAFLMTVRKRGQDEGADEPIGKVGEKIGRKGNPLHFGPPPSESRAASRKAWDGTPRPGMWDQPRIASMDSRMVVAMERRKGASSACGIP